MVLRGFAAMAFAGLLATPAVAEDAPALVYAPWIKFCLNDTCFIGTDGRSNADCPVGVAVVFMERDGDTKKTLRVTLPNRVNLSRGVRIIIDQGGAVERPFGRCFPSGCMADYEAGAELVDQLKQGQTVVLEAFDKANAPIRLTVPLAGFADAYDGPATEPKMRELILTPELQAKLEREKREEEERKSRCEAR
ncbi:MAG: invasion associated locus B family protein [Bradyrhizobium sp.]